jgi:hypothetical protein
MPDILYLSLSSLAVLAALLTAGFGVARQLPHLIGLAALTLVELGLLVQLATSIVLANSALINSSANLAEFFIYLAVALLVPLLAVFWALLERVFWSNYVLAVGAFTVFVMLARMHVLWTNN